MNIYINNLTFSYGNGKNAHKALDNVSLTINEGEFFGIIGHTGSGKSTFIQHLNGLMKIQSGEIKIGEYDLTHKKCKFKELRSKVGMVFQYPEYQLFAETVEKDIAFGLVNFFKDITEAEIKSRVADALALVGLSYEELKDKSPFDLSGGQKRRVAIAGVIVTRPEILILDEPSAGLDPSGKDEIMRLLHSLHKNCCKTIIIISHDMDEIAENCTKVAVFENGKIACVKPPEQLFEDYERLINMGLDVPVTVKILNILKQKRPEIKANIFDYQKFVEEIISLK